MIDLGPKGNKPVCFSLISPAGGVMEGKGHSLAYRLYPAEGKALFPQGSLTYHVGQASVPPSVIVQVLDSWYMVAQNSRSEALPMEQAPGRVQNRHRP